MHYSAMPKAYSRRRYTLEDLRVFLAVVEEGSISAGAERCFLAPSSVSERISTLETSLGTTLLQRIARGVKPTPAGRILVANARRCLVQLEQMHADLADHSRQVRSRVTLFANGTSLTSRVPRALEAFFVANPTVDVELFEQNSDQVIQGVASGQADVGVAAHNQHPDLRFMPFCREEFTVIASPDHAVAVNQRMRFIDCLQERFVGLRNESSLHRFVQDRARDIGRSVTYRVQVTEIITLCNLVAAGVGISIVPRSLPEQLDCRLCVLPLDEPWAVRQLYICMRATSDSLNPNAEELAEHIQRQG